MTESHIKRSQVFPLLFVLCIAAWLRFPYINAGLPYFYNEDEAHHFNRVVNMVKSGTFNPGYFHKPSLHFYLRMPVVAASFLWEVSKGRINRIEEIRTQDPFGVARYAFTASHTGVVKWNRAFSVFLSLLLILFSYLLAREVLDSHSLGLVAALLVSLSPDIASYSATIGVDISMSLLCVMAVYFGIKCIKGFSYSSFLLCALSAGLAVSSKYNALPVMILPFVVALYSDKCDARKIAVSLVVPVVAFFLGSPFILVSIPLFLDQFAYEIWHYGLEGHVGHVAEPGFPQFVFYLKWLGSSAVGFGALVLCVLGVLAFLFREDAKGRVFLVFPILFGFLMCMQKANFTRNMLVIVPFVSIASACGVQALAKLLQNKGRVGFAVLVLTLIIAVQPFAQALRERSSIQHIPESRREVESLIRTLTGKQIKTAVSGQLQLSPEVYELPGVSRVSDEKLSAAEIYNAGFAKLIVSKLPDSFSENPNLFKEDKVFDGVSEKQRIVQNPRVSVFSRIDAANLAEK